ncbi:hypothetical protein ACJMK2_023637 [Sinanodonta woodiana]|uniref:Uncharacterized protein n=1 Tax=Sinanodonta woodiana TaxID=1069815 RepID=A0ABD3T508_SINWO
MKFVVLLLTISVAVVCIQGETCPSGHATDCTLTLCTGDEWMLSCVDNICTCNHNNGQSHACTNTGDCSLLGHGCLNNQHWRCIRGECRCTHQN